MPPRKKAATETTETKEAQANSGQHRRARATNGNAAKRKPSPVEVIRPNPAVWNAALQLCGDPKRLRAIDANTVLIRNHA